MELFHFPDKEPQPTMQKVIKSHCVTLKIAFRLRSAKNVPRANFYDHIITTLNSDR